MKQRLDPFDQFLDIIHGIIFRPEFSETVTILIAKSMSVLINPLMILGFVQYSDVYLDHITSLSHSSLLCDIYENSRSCANVSDPFLNIPQKHLI